MYSTNIKPRRAVIAVGAMNPTNDGVRRKTPPPGKAFRPAKGAGGYRRQPKFRSVEFG